MDRWPGSASTPSTMGVVVWSSPIGGPERWRQIVANLAVIVDELDHTFLRELERAIDPAPDWFEPAL